MKTKTTKSRRFTESLSTGASEPEEWFFAKVPEDEIVSCFYYEYARERNDICQLFRYWRRTLVELRKAREELRDSASEKFWRELARLTDSTCSHCSSIFPNFRMRHGRKFARHEERNASTCCASTTILIASEEAFGRKAGTMFAMRLRMAI